MSAKFFKGTVLNWKHEVVYIDLLIELNLSLPFFCFYGLESDSIGIETVGSISLNTTSAKTEWFGLTCCDDRADTCTVWPIVPLLREPTIS